MNNVINIFKENSGFLESWQLQRNSRLYAQLRKLVEAGNVIKIKSGLYKHPEIETGNEYIKVSKIYPDGVICLYSAWSFYELTTFIPSEYHLAFPSKKKVNQVDYPPIQPYFWIDRFYKKEIKSIEGIRIYSIEKSICDAFRYRTKIGEDIFGEVVKTYLKRKDRDLNRLFKVARNLKIEKQVEEVITLLLA